ncbi:4-phosphoerythronate dehydrogenase [Aestuariibacter salexigens]|uniref:4-phosphoerythronate dehydrogenase n=1 Tax=Aestuariibacter salexigens TaxID=226010 RepID=UPI0004247BDC|nr:4-phosphoerythronate dehydrogenase [Aestuariibacter salexigens]
MRILYDDNMPYGDIFFNELGQATAFNHRHLRAEDLNDVDALLVRSTTKVDSALLQYATRLRYVATATAGINHLDTHLLEQREISWGHAGGCNATAVAEYVISAILALSDDVEELTHKTIGIVGAGHVGSQLAAKLEALNLTYKLYDPPLRRAGDCRHFASFEDILQCDIISLHVPLNRDGQDKTLHMFNEAVLASLRPDQVLINAARGEVVDNAAALRLLEKGKSLNLVLDVWENEPDILMPLVPFTRFSTAHIAGHTLEGKAKGTFMLYQQLCRLMSREPTQTLDKHLPVWPHHVDKLPELSDLGLIRHLAFCMYDIRQDSKRFRASVTGPEPFSYMRKHYPIRREFSACRVNAGNSPESQAIYRLGFSAA